MTYISFSTDNTTKKRIGSLMATDVFLHTYYFLFAVFARNAEEEIGNKRVHRKSQEHPNLIDQITFIHAKISSFENQIVKNLAWQDFQGQHTPTSKTPAAPCIQPQTLLH